MADPNGTEATAEYYIVRVYRRRPGTASQEPALAGIVEEMRPIVKKTRR